MAAELNDGIRIRARNAVARVIVLRCVRAARLPKISRIENISMSPMPLFSEFLPRTTHQSTALDDCDP